MAVNNTNDELEGLDLDLFFADFDSDFDAELDEAFNKEISEGIKEIRVENNTYSTDCA